MKTQTGITIAVVAVVALVIGFFLNGMGGLQEQSITGQVVTETGEVTGKWANNLVGYNLLTVDEYDGSDVATTAKVYETQPADWENPRGDFSETSEYNAYVASSGVVEIDGEFPGTYYVVLTASGANTEFEMITIPDGSGRTIDVADYNTAPDSRRVEMSLVGATTDEDFSFTLANGTSTEVSEQLTLKLNEGTELRGWKAVIEDIEGFSTDADNDGTYDEGIKKLEVTIGTESARIFEPAVGVDEFDSNDKYEMDLSGLVVKSEKFLTVAVDIKADTSDSVGANDEAWGEGEGVLAYIYIYDNEGNLFSTVDITA